MFGISNKTTKENANVPNKDLDSTGQQTPAETPAEEKPQTNPTEAVKEQEEPTVSKKVTCPRCDGDGIWHSSRSGVRALRSPEPLIDPKRRCPKCKGEKVVTIRISQAQALMEVRVDKAKKGAEQAAAKARAAADHADRLAKEAEAKLK